MKDTQKNIENPYGKKQYKKLKSILKNRLKPSRFDHSVRVAKTAHKMAKAYGVNPKLARMAGLLHDWDKPLSIAELKGRINHYKLNISEQEIDTMPWILHGITAAAYLKDKYPEFDDSLFSAIARHTTGAKNMSKLDMIIYIADKIEPGHSVKAYKKLYKLIGKKSLENIFVSVQQNNLVYLVKNKRPISNGAIDVWNSTLALSDA